MITEKEQKFNEILEDIADVIDISPYKYKQAVDRYTAVGKYLESGKYPKIINLPEIYVQGSFRLGTVIRPIKNAKEADYDIDLVCQMPIFKENTSPRELKHIVGNYLKLKYNGLLTPEGRRCWTLEYAEEDGAGFHMDVLPCIPMNDIGKRILKERVPNTEYYKHCIDITNLDKKTQVYSWPNGGSNPKGFGEWFDNKKMTFSNYKGSSSIQKQKIYERTVDKYNRQIFANVNDVPEPLVRTPLQQIIQILKHSRDIYFKNNPDDKPISMIITTLCARFYKGEDNLFSTFINIINNLSEFAKYIDAGVKFSENVKESQAMIGITNNYNPLIDKPIYKINGKWWIPNPVNPAENFADRWDYKKSEEFFKWLQALKQVADHILQSGRVGFDKISSFLTPSFGDKVVKNVFEKIAVRTRNGLNSKIIKTTSGTGVLSIKGDTTNAKHTFHD